MHTRTLRRLGLVAMALATLSSCIAADYLAVRCGSSSLALLPQVVR